jgi:hypothetical protein
MKKLMKKSKLMSLAILLCGLMWGHSAWPRGHFGEFALGYGLGYGLGHAPFAYYGYYGYPYAYYGYTYPPAIVVPSTPPVYIQRNEAPPSEPNYWYYCRKPAGYYPYVRECPGGWLQVTPQPPVR